MKEADVTYECFFLIILNDVLKQLSVYYYRGVYCENGYSKRPGREDSQLEGSEGGVDHDRAAMSSARLVPRDIIKPTIEQQRAMGSMFEALREEDS